MGASASASKNFFGRDVEIPLVERHHCAHPVADTKSGVDLDGGICFRLGAMQEMGIIAAKHQPFQLQALRHAGAGNRQAMVEIDRLAEHRAGSSKKRQVAFAAQKLLALQQLPIGLAAMVAVGFHLKPLDFAGKCCGHLFGQQPEGGVDMPLGQDCLQRPDDFTACILDQGNRHAGFVEHGRNDAVIRPQHGVAVIGPLMRQCKGAVRRKDGEGPVSDKAVGDILDEGLHDRRDRLPVNPCRANECDAGFSQGFSAVALFRLGSDRYRGGQTLYSPPQRHGFRFRGTPLLAGCSIRSWCMPSQALMFPIRA